VVSLRSGSPCKVIFCSRSSTFWSMFYSGLSNRKAFEGVLRDFASYGTPYFDSQLIPASLSYTL
jgi:hypothetical protein